MLWSPPDEVRETSTVGRFLAWLEHKRGLRFADHQALWEWSVTDLDGFWSAVWEYFGVIAHTP